MRVSEARLLALMLRTSRLTWLFAADGTDKSELLTQGVLPLLRRRHFDRLAPTAALPNAESARDAIDRRAAAASQSQKRETVVYFDGWSDAPLEALKSRLIQSLPAKARSGLRSDTRLDRLIGDIESGFDLKLVFVLNNFERFFGMSTGSDARSAFAEEWCEAVARPGLAAGFLVALDENCRPRLEMFRQRVPGLDHNALCLLAEPTMASTLPGVPSEPPAKAAQGASTPATPSAGRTRHTAARAVRLARRAVTPPAPPIKVDEVYAFIESTLKRTAVQSSPSDWPLRNTTVNPGVPVLSLNFDDEAYASPATRMGAEEDSGLDNDAAQGAYRPPGPAGGCTQQRSPGRGLMGAFKRFGGAKF